LPINNNCYNTAKRSNATWANWQKNFHIMPKQLAKITLTTSRHVLRITRQ